MESDLEPKHERNSSEPVLEVVEGDMNEEPSDRSIVPNAFESVLEKTDEAQKYVETEAPPYKNRAFIAVVFLIAGILAGRLTTPPKIEKYVVEKPVPVATNQEPLATPKVEAPKVDQPFREFSSLDAFDPWQPMNGGFPMPPKETQAAIVGRSGGAVAGGTTVEPPTLSGKITPMDPGEISGPLPNVNDPGAPLPAAGAKVDPKPDSKGSAAPTTVGRERYVSVSMNGPEPIKGQASISSIASNLGGTARTFTHMAEDGTVEAQGVLVILPAGKYDEALSKIEALGGATIDGTFEGNASDQQSRIQSLFNTRLTKLQTKKKDLLVDFLDDAPIIKQMNEAIDFETRAVSATRLPSGLDGKAVIRILLK